MKILRTSVACIMLMLSMNIMALDFSGSGHEYLANVSSGDLYKQGIAAGTASTILSVLYYESVVCTPQKVTNEQFAVAVKQFLSDHPERLHEQIYVLGADALMTAFPCEKTPLPPSVIIEDASE